MDVLYLDDGSLLCALGGQLAKISADGTHDFSYDNDGFLSLSNSVFYSRLHRDLFGNIWAWGTTSVNTEEQYYFYKILNSAGYPISSDVENPDASIIRFLYPPSFGQMVNQTDGKILFSGRSSYISNSGVKAYLARFDPSLLVEINHHEKTESVVISPNPCSSGNPVFLSLKDNSYREVKNMRLFSIGTGTWSELSCFANSTNNFMTLNIGELAPGVYMIQFEADHQVYQTKLIVAD